MGRLIPLWLDDPAIAIGRLAGSLPRGIKLRSANLDQDLGLISELYNAAMEPDDPIKATPEQLANYARHPGFAPAGVCLAFDGDLAVGLGVGRLDVPAPGTRPHQGIVELLAVRPGYRRRGIGRALVHALLGWLVEQGVTMVGASAENAGVVAVLEKYGFHKVGS